VIGPTPWKVIYTDCRREPAVLYTWALAHCGPRCTSTHYAAASFMVWDHCHIHGYIRGALCAYRDGRMSRYDSGHQRFADDPDLIDHARRCAGCFGPWCPPHRMAVLALTRSIPHPAAKSGVPRHSR
jgi:hypothetical protein